MKCYLNNINKIRKKYWYKNIIISDTHLNVRIILADFNIINNKNISLFLIFVLKYKQLL